VCKTFNACGRTSATTKPGSDQPLFEDNKVGQYEAGSTGGQLGIGRASVKSGKQKSHQTSESDVTIDETGLATAARSPGQDTEALTPQVAIESKTSNELSDDNALPTPGYWDDGISLYVERWSSELGDDDLQRSVERAHHIWWNSKLPRDAFHNAMKAAHHETRAKLEAGKIHGAPMAYLLTVLRTTASEQCVRLGLPRLEETREEQRERMALSGFSLEDLELAARLDGLKSEDQVERRPRRHGRRQRRRTLSDTEREVPLQEAAAS
jgi:hypothetical protein